MNLIEEIEASRVNIRALQAERTELEACVRSRDEVRAYVRAQVEAWYIEGQRHSEIDVQRVAIGQMPDLLDIEQPRGIGPLLVRMLGRDALEAGLLAGIRSVPEGADRGARAARIGEINTELDEVEAREEALIEQAEAAGVDVWRRGDARPEIVLQATPAR